MGPAMEECYSPHPKKLAELWNAMQAAAAWPAGMGLAYRPMLPFPSFTPPLTLPSNVQHGSNFIQTPKFKHSLTLLYLISQKTQ